ncbi:PhoX family protein [Streptomyces sp. NPDC059452]|uniref:PhoX family protein n=1 Tax=Streptomyces sp. NPDC059452 TaxID=3346835 RepID=UPI00367A7AC6
MGRDTDRTLPAPAPGPAPDRSRPAGATRRSLLVGGALVAAGLLTSGSPAALAAPRPEAARSGSGAAARTVFRPVPVARADELVVPKGYVADVIARWGDPVRSPAPRRGTAPATPATAAEQAGQVGSHHHGVHVVPLAPGPGGERRGLLVLAHESADELHTAASPATAMAAQGLTVVAVASGPRDGGAWRTVDSPFNRRITATTPVRLTGPAAGTRLGGAGGAQGVVAPGALGATPWGTVLAAEENANAFFGTDDLAWQRSETDVRHGFSAAGFGHPWHTEDPRFDLASDRARPEHFGWIVEVDPQDPASVPAKRTALGRFPHGSATVSEADGRVVVHTTDAEDGEYAYRFTGSAPWRRLRAKGLDPLDHGTLEVARLSADGTGEWIPLTHGSGPLTRENGWRDQADVLVRARLAADAVGATPLARPERVAVHPATADVYLALAGGVAGGGCGAGGADGCAPGASPHGSVVRLRPAPDGPATARDFSWETFLTGNDPRATPDGAFAHPKGLWFDASGVLWISTGIPGHLLGGADGPVGRLGNNALLAADPETGEVRRFLTAPRGAEVTGVAASADGATLFVNIQHPGRRTATATPDRERPGTVSNWPDRTPDGPPRSATVAVRRA